MPCFWPRHMGDREYRPIRMHTIWIGLRVLLVASWYSEVDPETVDLAVWLFATDKFRIDLQYSTVNIYVYASRRRPQYIFLD